MNAANYLVEYLHAKGVTQIFEVIGGMITQIVDATYQQKQIKLVSMHHEQAAAFAADAYGRLTGIPGVAIATSGPGATNLITGIGSCYFDSVPAIFITGQVNTSEQHGTKPIRQLGFQETDIVSIVSSITKAAFRVESANDLPAILRSSFKIATTGRPGPVLVDIPMNVQKETVNFELPAEINEESSELDLHQIESLLDKISQAKRPIVLAGGGIRASHSNELFKKFIEIIQVPVVHSLLAKDALPYTNPYRIGMIGTYGNRYANLAMANSDLLLVLGSRLDIRQTGADTLSFAKDRIIYHVDCDEHEINNRIIGCIPVITDLNDFLKTAITIASKRSKDNYDPWMKRILKWKTQWPDENELMSKDSINPNFFMHQLSHASDLASIYIVDVGNHQMWAAQSIEIKDHQKFITSGGMGSMGYALPAAIGATYAVPGKPVVIIAGDGGMQMNIQELETLVHHHYPIKIVVIHNNSLGMVRQFQESYFENRYQSTYWGYSAPDFVKIAHAYGIPGSTVTTHADLPNSFGEMWESPMEPYLLQVMIDPLLNVYPKIAFGYPITEMEPFVKPKDMEST